MKKILFTFNQFVLVCLVLVGMMQVNGLLAQGTSGTILGVVQDASEAVLPGVTVMATNLETNQSRTAISDDEGRYRLAQLPPGNYEVQSELSGFNTQIRGPIALTVGRQAVVDFSLGVGGIEERVVVTGEAPLVETTSAVTAGLVSDKQIRDLPLNGRDFVQLALMQEGVVTSTKIGRGQAGNEGVLLSLGGARIHQNAFLLDGTDIRGSRGTVPAGAGGRVAGVETIKEFKVITGAFSAEYGRFTGGVITAVTKSGTNSLHGSVYEFHRNSALDARNFFDRDVANPTVRSDVPAFKRNQFGFSLGGPVVKDKTFFFGSFEGLRESLTETQTRSVPTDAARAGQLQVFNPFARRFVPVPVSDRMQPFIALMPRANGQEFFDAQGRSTGSAEHISTEHQPTNQETSTFKIDQEISEADSFFARYTLDQSDKQTFWSNQGDLAFSYRYQYLTLEEKHIFSPNLISVTRVGFTRSKAIQLPVETVDVDPSLRFSVQPVPVQGQFFGVFPFGNFLGLYQIPNNFSYSEDLSWTRGSHFLKMGGIITRMQYNGETTVSAHGTYVFNTVAGFLQGEPLLFRSFGNPTYTGGTRENIIGFYFQDDWKFSPRLTINMGLRYEFITGPNEVGTGESVGRPEIKGRVSNLVNILDTELHLGNPLFPNPSKKNFSPRIGFAWDVFGNAKTSVRGGFGVFFDQLTSYLYGSAQVFNPPFALRILNFRTFGPRSTFPPVGPNADPYSGANAQPTLWAMGDVKQPYMMQYSLTIQQEVMPDTVLSVAYSGSVGRKLPRMVEDANIAIPIKYDASQYPNGPGPEFNGRTYFPFCTGYNPGGVCPSARGASNVVSLPERNPTLGSVRMELWDGNSAYNALRLGLSRRFSAGLAFQLAYNWSKSIDDSSNVGHSDNNGGGAENSGWQVVDPDDKATMRGLSGNHVAHTFSSNFTYELPFSPQGAARHLLGGWSINGIVTAATGPVSSFSIDDDRAHSEQDAISQRPELVPGASNNPILHGGREPNEYYDVSALTLAPEGFFGNLGRNTLTSPGIITFDFGVSKDFTLHEEAKLQFRAELFNVFNRANFSQPNMNVFGGGGTRDPTAGRITTTTTTSRQIQVALKILF